MTFASGLLAYSSGVASIGFLFLALLLAFKKDKKKKNDDEPPIMFI